jgi:hypothetical protein
MRLGAHDVSITSRSILDPDHTTNSNGGKIVVIDSLFRLRLVCPFITEPNEERAQRLLIGEETRTNHQPMKRPILLSVLICAFPAGHLFAQQTINYAGDYISLFSGTGGTITMDVTYWPNDSISGYVNFTEYPGNPTQCGAGDFTGYREADSLFHSFISYDPDPGCGFDWGVEFELVSAVHNDLDSISGAYSLAPGQTAVGFGTYNLVSINTGIHGPTSNRTIERIYPNPTGGPTTLHVTGVVQARHLTLFDATGRAVSQRSVANMGSTITIDLSGMENGMYLARVEFADGTWAVERLIKE